MMLLLLASTLAGASPDGYKGWVGGTCPCSDPKLCDPITAPRLREDVYVFHTKGNSSWRSYDWSQITTICVFGPVDPALLCHAHSVGARLTLGASGPPTGKWNDTTAVATWVASGIARVVAGEGGHHFALNSTFAFFSHVHVTLRLQILLH
jgi:hypothetical protein